MKPTSGYLVIYSLKGISRRPWGAWQHKRTRKAADQFAERLRAKVGYVVAVVSLAEMMDKANVEP